MTALTREQILLADDLPRELVDVPEWGGQVFVRALDGAGRAILERSKTDERDMRSLVVMLCVCDETGVRLFNQADVDALAQKSAVALHRVFEVATRLSVLGREGRKNLKNA